MPEIHRVLEALKLFLPAASQDLNLLTEKMPKYCNGLAKIRIIPIF